MTTEEDFAILHQRSVELVAELANQYGTRETVTMLLGACIGLAIEGGHLAWVRAQLLPEVIPAAERMYADFMKTNNNSGPCVDPNAGA